MIVDFSIGSRGALVTLSGELDHHCASGTLREIQRFLDAELPGALTVDMKGVAFMDSSGIGLIMGRSKLMHECGGILEVRNPQPYIKRVLKLAGIERIVKIT